MKEPVIQLPSDSVVQFERPLSPTNLSGAKLSQCELHCDQLRHDLCPMVITNTPAALPSPTPEEQFQCYRITGCYCY